MEDYECLFVRRLGCYYQGVRAVFRGLLRRRDRRGDGWWFVRHDAFQMLLNLLHLALAFEA